jgi:glycosyltransferase involved in cell wall biosynthesis
MKIAYLAPEIPSLSATFVYEELQALERRGIAVLPLSVQRPATPAQGQDGLALRTRVIYDGPKWRLALAGARCLPSLSGTAKALRWLWADVRRCGLLSTAAAKLVFQFLAAGRVACLMKEQSCDHLHVHFVHVPAQIGMYASALAGIPFTCTAHANDIFERGQLLAEKAERAQRMLTISEHNLAYLKRLGVSERKLALVRCGVSFTPPGGRHPKGLEGHWRIGSLGRLVEKKGMDILLAAVAALAKEHHEIELEIAGDGPLRWKLEAMSTQLGLGQRVRFIGNLPHHAVAGWLAGLDAFVLACRPDGRGDMDGIPVALMEAMSQGVPVVSTRLSGIPELVIDGRTGLLARPADAADLAAQIRRLLSSAELQAVLAAGALEHVRSEFSQEVNLDRLLACFELEPQPAEVNP